MRLAHLSDLHLGFRGFAGLERGSNLRELDLARAFERAVRQIVRLRPDLILLTGDVFDHPDPPSSATLTLLRGLGVLRSRLPRAPVLVIAGERDSPRNPATLGPVAALDTLPGVEAAAGAARSVRFRDLGVHALLVPHRAVVTPPFPDLRRDPDVRWNVLLLRGAPGLGSGIQVRPGDWNYVAVGGLHRAHAWAPNVVCSGSLERPGRDPWASATEETGFTMFDLSTGESEFCPISGRAVVDLAPVRLTPGDPGAGTRRFRELLEGVPGGVAGKLVRARFEGDVLSVDEGVSPGLLAAVRGQAAHLEVRVSGGRAVAPPRLEIPHSREEVELLDRDGEVRETHLLPPGIVLVTAASAELRGRLAREVRGGDATRSPSNRTSTWRLRVASNRGRPLAWAGREDWRELMRDAFGVDAISGGVAERPEPAAVAADDLPFREAALRNLRADSVEASGDLDAKALEWARERQDAESHLYSYRSRAVELRSRLRTLEAQRETAACPACERPLGESLSDLLTKLREEWDSVVQDGQWWARRRDQLDSKPEDLRKMEEAVLRLHARVESEGEHLEVLRERARHRGEVEKPSRTSAPLSEWAGLARTGGTRNAREVLRHAGNLLGQITDGAVLGLRIGDGLRLVGRDGSDRNPAGQEVSTVLGALHIGLWMADRERMAPGTGLLLWELHEDGVVESATRALEVLSGEGLESDVVVAVVAPAVLDRIPELYSMALELTEDEAGRRTVRRYVAGTPSLTIRLA